MKVRLVNDFLNIVVVEIWVFLKGKNLFYIICFIELFCLVYMLCLNNFCFIYECFKEVGNDYFFYYWFEFLFLKMINFNRKIYVNDKKLN